MGNRFIINYYENGSVKAITVIAGNVISAIEEAIGTGDVKIGNIVNVIKT